MPPPPTSILVVDTDQNLRVEVRNSLQPLGFQLQEVATPRDARDSMERGEPALILLDVQAGRPEDLEFCTWVRAQPGLQRLPILALVEPGFGVHCERGFWAGVSDFCFKPLQAAILAQRVCLLLDIEKMGRELAQTRERLTATQRTARVGTWELALTGWRLNLSEEALRIFGLEPARFHLPAAGQSPESSGGPADPLSAPHLDALFENQFNTLLERVHEDDRPSVRQICLDALHRRSHFGIDCRLVLPDGALKWISGRGETLFGPSGLPHRLFGTIQDVTERRETQKTLHQLSSFDTLTGLPNRNQFTQQLERAIGHSRHTGRKVAVVHLGMNRFKRVNESLGHQAGDELLGQIAQRLKNLLRNNDLIGLHPRDYDGDANLARLGGDEFILLLAELQLDQHAAQVVSRLLGDLARTYVVQGQEVTLDAAAGIALFPDHGEHAKELINNADAAMHFSKHGDQGGFGGGYGFYNSAINENARLQLAMESDLRRAVERQELRPFFQPKVDTSNRIRSAEMLVRWRHPVMGMLTPDKFISVAEEVGLIIPISEWLIRTGARQLKAWINQGHAEMSLAINLSPAHFHHPDLVNTVREAIERNELPDGSLELELTEGMLMDDLEETVEILQALKGTGARLAIDDFGTGYSSLSYLTRFPVDVLKIDRSFVRDINKDTGHFNIVKAIIAMAHSLELDVVAEGVEYTEQANTLRDLECDLIQGYLFGRPMPATDMSVRLAGMV